MLFDVRLLALDMSGSLDPVDALMRTFKLDRSRAEVLTRRLPHVVKRNVQYDYAQKLVAMLAQIGGTAEIVVAGSTDNAAPLPKEPGPEPVAAAPRTRQPTLNGGDRMPRSTMSNERLSANDRMPRSTMSNERMPRNTMANDRMPRSTMSNERGSRGATPFDASSGRGTGQSDGFMPRLSLAFDVEHAPAMLGPSAGAMNEPAPHNDVRQRPRPAESGPSFEERPSRGYPTQRREAERPIQAAPPEARGSEPLPPGFGAPPGYPAAGAGAPPGYPPPAWAYGQPAQPSWGYQMPPGQMPPGQMPPGQMPPGQMPPGQMPPGYPGPNGAYSPYGPPAGYPTGQVPAPTPAGFPQPVVAPVALPAPAVPEPAPAEPNVATSPNKAEATSASIRGKLVLPPLVITGPAISPKALVVPGTRPAALLGALLILFAAGFALVAALVFPPFGVVVPLSYVALFAFDFLRRFRVTNELRGVGLPVGQSQLQELHLCVKQFASRLGIPASRLYVTRGRIDSLRSLRFGLHHYIELDEAFLLRCVELPRPEILSFLLARELARHALGHTRTMRRGMSVLAPWLGRIDVMSADAVAADLVGDRNVGRAALIVLLVGPRIMEVVDMQDLERAAASQLRDPSAYLRGIYSQQGVLLARIHYMVKGHR